MHESLKAVCIVGFMFGTVVAAVGWGVGPSESVWMVRIISTAIAVVGLVGFLVLNFRKDRAPDFLVKIYGGYFDRGGLCFSLEPTLIDGCVYVRVLFQNRYARRCRGQFALRPAEVFGWVSRRDAASTVDFDCPPAGFGMVLMPLVVPSTIQGKLQAFQVGATVEYPEGRGRMLRFGSAAATSMRTNADFRAPFNRRLTIAAALGGMIFISRPPLFKIAVPSGVPEFPREPVATDSKVFWQLGEGPELSQASYIALYDRE